jgi:hypothetical protein
LDEAWVSVFKRSRERRRLSRRSPAKADLAGQITAVGKRRTRPEAWHRACFHFQRSMLNACPP